MICTFLCHQIILNNGPAKKISVACKLQEAGDLFADPFEISTIRKEVSVWFTSIQNI